MTKQEIEISNFIEYIQRKEIDDVNTLVTLIEQTNESFILDLNLMICNREINIENEKILNAFTKANNIVFLKFVVNEQIKLLKDQIEKCIDEKKLVKSLKHLNLSLEDFIWKTNN